MVKKHFVTFMSPGTFVAETTTKEIKSWDVNKAVEMSKEITERYDATPFGFYFTTRGRTAKDLDSKVIKTSGMYYLGGTILTLEDIKERNNPDDKILISNMEVNDIKEVVQNCNSWAITRPFYRDKDVLIDMQEK